MTARNRPISGNSNQYSGNHGANFSKPIAPNYPKIAGQNAAYTEQQMKDIKSGARNNGQTAAKGVMHLVNDEEIKALSEYLAKLK